MKDCSNYCDHFWGSHGCSIPPDEPHEVHECRVTSFYDNGEPVETVICSQMRIVGPLEKERYGLYGKAEVRFMYQDRPEFSEWSEWQWFKNCDPPMTAEFVEEG